MTTPRDVIAADVRHVMLACLAKSPANEQPTVTVRRLLDALTAANITLCPAGWVCVPDTLAPTARELAKELKPIIDRYLVGADKKHPGDMIHAVLWDNKIGILKMAEAIALAAAPAQEAMDG